MLTIVSSDAKERGCLRILGIFSSGPCFPHYQYEKHVKSCHRHSKRPVVRASFQAFSTSILEVVVSTGSRIVRRKSTQAHLTCPPNDAPEHLYSFYARSRQWHHASPLVGILMLRFVSTNSPKALSSWNTCVPAPRLMTITYRVGYANISVPARAVRTPVSQHRHTHRTYDRKRARVVSRKRASATMTCF